MAEYIDREATIEALAQMQWHDENGYPVDDYEEKKKCAEDWISQVPSADVQTVKHGRWISVGHKLSRICSVCDCDEPYKFADDDANAYNYCPNCGAMMKDGENNAE